MTAHLTDPPARLPELLAAARYERPHTRALRLGLEKYGPTPIFDAVTAAFAAPPVKPRRTQKPRTAPVKAQS